MLEPAQLHVGLPGLTTFDMHDEGMTSGPKHCPGRTWSCLHALSPSAGRVRDSWWYRNLAACMMLLMARSSVAAVTCLSVASHWTYWYARAAPARSDEGKADLKES